MAADGGTRGWQEAAYAAMVTRSNYPSVVVETLDSLRRDLPALQHVGNVLSVGPGRGELDVMLLRLLPTCTRYVGVEPDPAASQHLTAQLRQHHPNISATLHPDRVEDWVCESSPGGQFDLIVVAQLLYFLSEPRRVLSKLLELVRPGGMLLIVHGDNNFASKSSVEFGLTPPGKGSDYRQPELRLDLHRLGVDILTEVPVTTEFDLRCKDAHLANAVFVRQTSQPERDALFGYLDQIVPDGVDKNNIWITIVTKSGSP